MDIQDLENGCYDLLKGTANVFDWKDLDETRKISVSVAQNPTRIPLRYPTQICIGIATRQ
jgi:hypothetical protein